MSLENLLCTKSNFSNDNFITFDMYDVSLKYDDMHADVVTCGWQSFKDPRENLR